MNIEIYHHQNFVPFFNIYMSQAGNIQIYNNIQTIYSMEPLK